MAKKSAKSRLHRYNYVITARNIVKGNFGTEVGEPRFLRVPRGEGTAPRHEIKPERWLTEVRDIADGMADGIWSEHGDVLVFVHGYNNTMAEVRTRQEILQDDLLAEGWKGVVVSYDWPCANQTLNYLEDREDAADTAKFLVTHGIGLIVEGQVKNDCQTNIHLLGHSTGAYVIMEAFSSAQKVGDFFRQPWRVGQVAFIAGDVAADTLDGDSDWGSPMFSRIMRLTNYSNGFDTVLAVSNAKRLGTAPRAGRIGLTAKAHAKAVNVNCSEYFRDLDPDEQKRKVGSWNHSWHIGNALWARDLALTISGCYDREVITTREKRFDGLHLKRDGARPPYEAKWEELAAGYPPA